MIRLIRLNILFILFFNSHKDISGNDFIFWQFENIPAIVLVCEVFHFDKSGKDNNSEQPQKI